MLTIDEQFNAIKRGTLEIVPEEALKAKLKKSQETGKPLKIKLGLDRQLLISISGTRLCCARCGSFRTSGTRSS